MTQDLEPEERPVPGMTSGEWAYVAGRYVRRGKAIVLPWCPTVTQTFVTRDSRGESDGQQRYSIELAGDTATVDLDELKTGEAWGRFPRAAGGAGRDMRDALLSIVEDQASEIDEVRTRPAWVDGRLCLPPPEALATAGYLETRGAWEEWCHLAERTKDAPKIALLLSFTVAGIFLAPSAENGADLESVIAHAAGTSSEGKGTAMKVCASVFGNPRRIIRPWGSTEKGVLSYLRELEFLTGFRDELGANAQLTEPKRLESAVFTIVEGGERDLSGKTGKYRAPSSGWRGALISTGNLSIVGRIDNEAMIARVVEVKTPLTKDGPQSKALKGLAIANYGMAIQKIAASGITPADFVARVEKMVSELALPENNGVIERQGTHLAGALAGAWVLERVCGISGLVEIVRVISLEILENTKAFLKEKGERPYDRLWNLVHGTIVGKPSLAPTRDEYLSLIARDNPVDVIGWNVAEASRVSADLAIIPEKLRTIADKNGITDLHVAVQDGHDRGLVASHRGMGFRFKLPVGKERIPVYALRNPNGGEQEAQDSEVPTSSHESSHEVPTKVPTSGKAVTREVPKVPTSGRATYVVREGLTDDELLAVLAACTASDADLDAAATELERREKAAQLAAERPKPPSEGVGTGGQGSGRLRRSQTAKPVPGSRIATNAQVSDPSAQSAEHWNRWLANDTTQAALDRTGITLTPDLARRALVAWHRTTAGLAWDATPGRVGRNLHRRLRSTHPNMPEITPMTDQRANDISTGKNILIRVDFLNPHTQPEVGQHITSADVNNQFLAQAAMAVLGDGEPVTIKRVRDISLILKDPGYVILSKAVTIEDHPAFTGRNLKAGTEIPMPLAAYLHEWGVKLPVKEAVVWEKSGQRLNKHAEELKEFLTEARKWKTHADQEVRDAATIVEIAVKNIYAVTYGGQIRSERYAGEMLRRDWSDMIVALSYANALRGLDRAAYGVPVLDPETGKRNPYRKVTEARAAGQPMDGYALGLIKDTAYFVHENDEPTLPECLEVPETRQFGKWKQERHVAVTDAIAGAYEHGITALRNAINAEWKTVQK